MPANLLYAVGSVCVGIAGYTVGSSPTILAACCFFIGTLINLRKDIKWKSQ